MYCWHGCWKAGCAPIAHCRATRRDYGRQLRILRAPVFRRTPAELEILIRATLSSSLDRSLPPLSITGLKISRSLSSGDTSHYVSISSRF